MNKRAGANTEMCATLQPKESSVIRDGFAVLDKVFVVAPEVVMSQLRDKPAINWTKQA